MASDNQALWTALQSTFDKDIPVTTTLLELLQRERKSLEERDYDTFRDVLSDKQACLTTLESHAQHRQQWLQKAGLRDEKGALDLAETEAPTVAVTWRQLSEQWQQCQQLNEVNERIAKRTRLVVGQMLDMLRGRTGATKVYDNKGGTHSSGGGNSITSA